MNPREISACLQQELREQTKSLRPIDQVCPELAANLNKAIDDFPFVSSLYLENITYYEQGASLKELSNEDVICVETAHLFAAAFGLPGAPDKVHLYKHQEEAIRKAHDDKNIIVCTGTGSGKTESFLIPVIDWIIRCHKKDPGEMYTKGVRAMILYPMNALVNDQMRRLREIFKAAEKLPDNLESFDYDAIKNTSFGHYTGELSDKAERIDVYVPEDVDRQDRQQYRAHELQQLRGMVAEAPVVNANQVHYPHLSPEEKLENEYADRAAWGQNGADILITNYSMLERLMLDPEKASAIFNDKTWHYLVLDEAHTYDGACGTDISLLMRRVAERCGGAERLRYIATSATLVSDTETDKEGCIQKEFAAKLFPAEPESFAIMLGAPRKEAWPPSSIDESGYAALCYADSSSQCDAVAGELETSLKDFPDLLHELTPRDECRRLMGLTRWLKDWQQWSKPWMNTSKLLFGIVNGNLSVGDFVYIANQIAEINEGFVVTLEANGTTRACGALWRTVSEPDKYITEKTGETSISEIEAIRECLDMFMNQDGQIQLNSKRISICFIIFYECFCALGNTLGNDEELPSLAQLEVRLGNDCYASIRQMVKVVADMAGNNKISDLVCGAWHSALKKNEDSVESIEFAISEFILQRPHLERLYSALSTCNGHGTQEDLQNKVFGAGDADEFDAFLQLITLSQHPELKRKPLMDIRYHQMVSGISEMAVWFKADHERGYQAQFRTDDDGIITHEGDKDYPLYTLGLCHACAQPYIIVYRFQDIENPNEWRLSRYAGTEGNHGVLCAFSWLEGKHEIEDKEGDDETIWFNPLESRLVRNAICPGEGFIQTYYFKVANGKQFPQCAACCGIQTNNGIISEYKSGSDRARTTILRALVQNVDSESICFKSSIANGRKLLAFSDSRAGAAKLAINFDSYVESRIVGRHFLDAIHMDIGDFNEEVLYEYSQSFPLAGPLRTLCINRPILEQLPEDLRMQFLHNNNLANIENDVKGALWTYLPEFEKGLRQAQADRLLNKEYAYVLNGQLQVGSFNLPASLSLAALGLLRSPVRKNLIRQDVIHVYSHANASDRKNNDADWQNICNCFNPGEAGKFFDMMYKYFFLKAKLYAGNYDMIHGAVDYQCETNECLDGYTKESKKPIVFQGQSRNKIKLYIHARGKFVQELSGKLRDGNNARDTLDKIWHYLLRREILVNINGQDYAVNLNDVRFESISDGYPDIECNQYYRIEEHTAQLKSAQGRYHQTLFAEGKINILSCSTTFEMGVDLGNLNCVFLNNMPPAVANYKQRAGRAGRRPGSVSYVLTYTGGFGHDSHYSKHPEEMFFGEVTMPHIDPKNMGALAKHLRAEALHSFLSWCSLNGFTSWKKSGAFFLGKRVRYVRDNPQAGHWEVENAGVHCPEDGFITLLEAWRNDQDVVAELQQHCENLKPKGVELKYRVADDLLFQVSMNWQPDIGKTGGYDFQNEENCLNLAGPRIERNDGNMPGGIYIAPAEKRYSDKFDSIAGNDGVTSALVQMLEEQTTDVLTHYQVLPSYAFPCDVISLLPAVDERSNAVDMSRDIRTGLFEYSPGQVVIANKRSYESDMPMYYTQDGGEPRYISAGDNNEQLYFCTGCERYFAADVGTCPMCGGIGTEVEATTPDAFRAKKSKKAGGFSVTIPPHIERLYTGGIRDPRQVPGTNLQIANSKHRTILYINKVDTDTYVHKVRTDIVLWSMCKEQGLPDWNDDRMRYAWQSALEAILKATAKVMKLCKRDVDGEVAIIDGRRHFVLFDNASGGAGTILSLLPSEHNKKAMQVAHDILDEAIKICDCKHCKESGNAQSSEADKAPVLHTEYLVDPDDKREYCSCYGCLKSYDNQRIHARLDIHDAREILKAMLGNDNKAGGKQPAPEQARAQSGALVQKTQGGQKSMKDIVEEKKKGRKKQKLIQDILVNMISLDDKLVVEKDGTELEVTIVGFANPHRMTILVKDANGNNFDIDLNDIIRKA
ncbi:MAG: DEAD/DEAH box helicase [Akkermansia sp.]|nr:DEAD/DEAH box helicase [Akkermansia sp.]